MSGFSPSFISQVENGQASPSINSLQHICSALQVTLGEFFHAFSPNESPVTRVSERGQITSGWSKGTIQSLTGTSAAMEAILVTLAPGGYSGKQAASEAQGEFAYVLEGTLILSLNGEEIELTSGGCGHHSRRQRAKPPEQSRPSQPRSSSFPPEKNAGERIKHVLPLLQAAFWPFASSRLQTPEPLPQAGTGKEPSVTVYDPGCTFLNSWTAPLGHSTTTRTASRAGRPKVKASSDCDK